MLPIVFDRDSCASGDGQQERGRVVFVAIVIVPVSVVDPSPAVTVAVCPTLLFSMRSSIANVPSTKTVLPKRRNDCGSRWQSDREATGSTCV